VWAWQTYGILLSKDGTESRHEYKTERTHGDFVQWLRRLTKERASFELESADYRQIKIDATSKTDFVVRWGTDTRHGHTHDGIHEESALELAAETWKNVVKKVRFTADGWDEEEPEIEIVSPPKYTKWLYGLKGPIRKTEFSSSGEAARRR
jgi:hypothetical protein